MIFTSSLTTTVQSLSSAHALGKGPFIKFSPESRLSVPMCPAGTLVRAGKQGAHAKKGFGSHGQKFLTYPQWDTIKQGTYNVSFLPGASKA